MAARGCHLTQLRRPIRISNQSSPLFQKTRHYPNTHTLSVLYTLKLTGINIGFDNSYSLVNRGSFCSIPFTADRRSGGQTVGLIGRARGELSELEFLPLLTLLVRQYRQYCLWGLTQTTGVLPLSHCDPELLI